MVGASFVKTLLKHTNLKPMRLFCPLHSRGRLFSTISLILMTLLWPNALVHAGPVTINQVVQVIGNHQSPAELQLRGNAAVSGVTPAVDSSVSNQAGIAVRTDRNLTGVDITQGDVESTICDCGEILVAGGGLPKWPLLFLAALPFFFIDGETPPTFTPELVPTPPQPFMTPTPPNTPIPEPASLFLLGSGLLAFGAGFRQRITKSKKATKAQSMEQGT